MQPVLQEIFDSVLNGQQKVSSAKVAQALAEGIPAATILNEGMVGLGANNAKAQIDNVVVQRIAPETTLEKTLDFVSGDPDLFNAPHGPRQASPSGS